MQTLKVFTTIVASEIQIVTVY